jgi:3'(2'), 5'-bisphosphate nucleotidase
MRTDNEAESNGVSMGRPFGDHSIVDDALWAKLTAAVAAAAAATLDAPRTVRIKADHSPVTDADERSQTLLLEALTPLLPGVAVVSEEMAVRPSHLGDVFVLLDPLDGTREFVFGSGEYTVNLAIIRDRAPVAGIVAVPAAGLIYRGRVQRGAERLAWPRGSALPEASWPVRVRTAPCDGVVATISRSHLDPATVELLERLRIRNRVPSGSALKFCRIAEGAADIYPRLAPTREWDVAAGHALVVAAGGLVTLPDGGPLVYGEAASDFRVPAFIAWGDRTGVCDAAGAVCK